MFDSLCWPSRACGVSQATSLQLFSEIIETTAKNGVVPIATTNVKLFL